MADNRTQLSPGGSIVVGLLCGGIGLVIILVALGAFGEARLTDGTPPWVGVCAGLAFALAGLALMVGYGVAGGVGPDGDVLPGTPFFVRLVQYTVGIGIIVMLASIGSWIAFGPGPRHFSGGVSVGGVSVGGGAANETLGRVMFGIGAVLCWAFVAVMVVVSIKRLRRR